MAHIVIFRMPPDSVWKTKRTFISETKLQLLLQNKDQQRLRAYWDDFINVCKDVWTGQGHNVQIITTARWKITPQLLAITPGDLYLVPHTSNAYFPTDKTVLFYKQSMLPWFFTLDSGGWNGDSSVYPCQELVRAATITDSFSQLQKDIIKHNDSKFAQPPLQSWISLIRKKMIPFSSYIFLPLQMPHDDSILQHSPIGMDDLIIALSSWCNKTHVPLVIKGHPGNLAIRENLKHLATGKYVRWVDASIHDLIRNAKATYCINSGVGFEALLHGKPVVTFGRVEYDAVTIHGATDTLDETWEQVKKWDKKSGLTAYKKFFSWYCTEYAIDLRDAVQTQLLLKKVGTIMNKDFSIIAPLN